VEIDRTERVPQGDFETLNPFDPTAGGWPKESVEKGWKMDDVIPAGWSPHSASPPGLLRVLRGPEAHSGQAALYLGESCFVGGVGFPVKPGQVYRISYWAQGGGQAFLSGTKYGTQEGKTVFLRTDPLVPADLTPEWKQYVGAFRPTADVDTVVVLLQAGTRGDHACFDDVSIRQVSEIEGRVIDTFGALRQAGVYLEPSAAEVGRHPLVARLEKAQDELSQARRELDAALKLNPDAAVQRLAEQIDAEVQRLDPAAPETAEALCERINTLNGRARVAREAAGGLQFVDVRAESDMTKGSRGPL
jgi:hypothetical protein